MINNYKWTERDLGDVVVDRLRKLLGVFVSAVLYFVIVYHLGNLYLAENTGVESFMLMNGGIYTQLFWIGQIIIGSFAPLFLIYHPSTKNNRSMLGLASV